MLKLVLGFIPDMDMNHWDINEIYQLFNNNNLSFLIRNPIFGFQTLNQKNKSLIYRPFDNDDNDDSFRKLYPKVEYLAVDKAKPHNIHGINLGNPYKVNEIIEISKEQFNAIARIYPEYVDSFGKYQNPNLPYPLYHYSASAGQWFPIWGPINNLTMKDYFNLKKYISIISPLLTDPSQDRRDLFKNIIDLII